MTKILMKKEYYVFITIIVVGLVISYFRSSTKPLEETTKTTTPIVSVASDICAKDYATRARMSYEDSVKIKRELMRVKGVIKSSAYELDHILPLELGGSNQRNNLQLEPIAKAHIKDYYENYYHDLYCRGKISLQEAQQNVVSYE